VYKGVGVVVRSWQGGKRFPKWKGEMREAKTSKTQL
jgi:hypothetical protein